VRGIGIDAGEGDEAVTEGGMTINHTWASEPMKMFAVSYTHTFAVHEPGFGGYMNYSHG